MQLRERHATERTRAPPHQGKTATEKESASAGEEEEEEEGEVGDEQRV